MLLHSAIPPIYPIKFPNPRVSTEAAFWNYLTILDENKMYFTISDIKHFQKYQEQFLTLFAEGDLYFAFEIFNIFLNCKLNQLSFMKLELAKGIDNQKFETDKMIVLNRKEATWFENKEQRQEFWLNYLHRDIMYSKLEGRDNSSTVDYLMEQYKKQYLHVSAYKGEDCFAFIMNSVARLFYRTHYLSPTEYSKMLEDSKSIQIGIGVVIEKHDYGLKITKIHTDSPAFENELLKENQVIKSISLENSDCFFDATQIQNLPLFKEYIKKDKTVKLEVILDTAKPENTIICELSLKKIKIHEKRASSEIIEIAHDASAKTYKIGVIKIPVFYSKCRVMGEKSDKLSSEMKQILKDLVAKDVEGFIVDLRGNPGGPVPEGNKIIAMLMENYYYYTTSCIGKNKLKTKLKLNKFKSKTIFNQPFLCLVNHKSASLSEKVASAIKVYQRGLVVGETTYGKKVASYTVNVGYGSLCILSEVDFDGEGKSYNAIGIEPHIAIPSINQYNYKYQSEALVPNSEIYADIPVSTKPTPIINIPAEVLAELEDKSSSRKAKDPYFIYTEQINKVHETIRSQFLMPYNIDSMQRQVQNLYAQKISILNQLLQSTQRSAVTSLEEAKERYDIEKEVSSNALLESGKVFADYIYWLNNK